MTTIPSADIVGLQFGLVSDWDAQKLSVLELTKVPPKRNNVNVPIFGTMNCPTLGTMLPTTLCARCGGDIETCQGHCGHLNLFAPVVKQNYMNAVLKIMSSLCVRCGRLLLSSEHPRYHRLLRMGVRNSYKRCVNEVFKLTLRNRTCWFPLKDSPPEQQEENPRFLTLEESKVRGYCGMRQPDMWMRDEVILARPAWIISEEKHFEALPVITPNHLQQTLRAANRTTTRMMGFDPDHSPLEALMTSVLLVPPSLSRPSRSPHKPEDDISTTLGDIQKYNTEARKDVIPNLTLGLLRQDPSEQMTLTAARKKLRRIQGPMSKTHMRNKQPIVPECLEDYYLLQRAYAMLLDGKFYRKMDKEYGREPFSLKRRFAPGKRSRGRMRQNMLGKPGKFNIRGVSSCNTDMEIYQVGIPKQALMHCTFPMTVNETNYHDMLRTVLNGKHTYPGCNFVERDGVMYLPDANVGGLRLGDVVHCHWPTGPKYRMPVISNRQPSLHRFAIMGCEVILAEGNSMQAHMATTTLYNKDFDGDEETAFLSQDWLGLAEAMYLMNVRQNLMKDGCLVIGFVQHAVLGAYKLTEECRGPSCFVYITNDDIQRYLGIGWTPECVEPVLARWQERHGSMCDLTGKEFMSILLPTYDPTKHLEPLTKSSLNRFMADTIESVHDMDYAAKRIGFLTRILEAVCCDLGVTMHLDDCYLRDIPATVEVQANHIYADACELAAQQQQAGEDDSNVYMEREEVICNLLDKYRDVKGKYAMEVFEKAERACGMYDIIMSKSKGSPGNLTQNVVVVGQQMNEDNVRYPDTTSHYYRDELVRHGFVRNSFMDGLTPVEFFFHLRAARNGLVRIGCGTSLTGYVYRQIMKGVEDARISYQNTVCNGVGDILLFRYGFDPTFARTEDVRSVTLNIRDTVHAFAIKEDDDDDIHCGVEEVEHLLRLRERAIAYDPRLQVSVPVRFVKKMECAAKNCKHIAVSLNAARNRVAKMWLQLVLQDHIPNEEALECLFFEQLSTRYLLDRGYLCCCHVFNAYMNYIETSFGSNVAPAGDPVGAKAAQDPMQHLTQTNLKLFHITGEKTTAVDCMTRVKEILNMRQTIQQPLMHVHVLPEHWDTFDPMTIVELRLVDVVTKCYDEPFVKPMEAHWAHMQHLFAKEGGGEARHFLDCVAQTKRQQEDEPVFVTCFLNQHIMRRRELSPRILAYYVRTVALSDVDKDMALVTYAALEDPVWWITLSIIRSHTGPLLKSFCKQWKTEIKTLATPMLSLYLQHKLLNSRQLLAGVENIRDFTKTERMVLVSDEDSADSDGRLVLRKLPCYLTMGSNIQGVCSLPQIDVTFTTSNDIHQVFAEFGIAAAQKAIEENLIEAIQNSEKQVALQHIRLIAATMCHCGYPAPLTFSGMTSKDTATWFKRATFERCLDSFFGAAVAAREDKLGGVSEAVVVGAQISIGTGGDFDLITEAAKTRNDKAVELATRRSSMVFDTPSIESFLHSIVENRSNNNNNNQNADESIHLNFFKKQEDEDEQAVGSNASSLQQPSFAPPSNITTNSNNKRKRTNNATLRSLLPDPTTFCMTNFHYGPVAQVFVPSSPRETKTEHQEKEEHHYGMSDLFVPSSPKIRKKNESRKGQRRRFGDRNISEEGLRSLEHYFAPVVSDTKPTTKKSKK